MAPCDRVHDDELKVPAPLEVKLTDPVGVIAVPSAEVSVTVTVQVVAWLTTTEAGVHDTLVEVVRGLTVRVKVPEELECMTNPSPALSPG